MSKITFRADDELVERLEALDASKSEVMREALRAHLDGEEHVPEGGADASAEASAAVSDASDAGDALLDTLDALVAERVEGAIREREWERGARGRDRRRAARDINLNVTVDGAGVRTTDERTDARADPEPTPDERGGGRKTPDPERAEAAESRCDQCGETTSADHVYCPNCGEKSSHRVFCECGDELRSDWAFCPSCGRRTPAADVLDRA